MLRPDRSTQRAARRARRRPWLDHVLVMVALATVLLGYRSVVQGLDWWLTTVLVAGVVALVCGVLASLGTLASRVAVPAAALVGLLVVAWVFVPETLAAGVPTPSTFSALASMLERAQVLVMEEAAPAAAARPIVLLVVLAFAGLVLVAELLLRLRVGVPLLGLVLVAVHAAPALVAGETPSVWLFLVPAAAWLVLLRSRTVASSAAGSAGRGALVPTLVIGGSALLVAVLLPPVVPDVTAVAKPWGEPPPQVFGRGINPMLQLGQNLRRGSDTSAATYTTTAEDVPYLKVAMLRDFDGDTWRPARSRTSDRIEGQVDLADDIDVEVAETAVEVANLRSSMLPVPYPALDVDGLQGSWRWQRAGLTVSSEEATTEEQQYTVTSLDRMPTAEQMRQVSTGITPALQDYVDLPDGVPSVVTRLAREVTAGETNDYDRAIALQDHLRVSYRYSESAPVEEDYDGNGLDVLAEFLEVGAGYCVHFSSAMAVMARELDIPARIAVGYAPGSPVGTRDGETVYEITSNDLHAWPELYFRGVGWVPFEPTPGVGSPTGFEEPASADASTGDAAPEPTPTPDEEGAQGRSATTADDVAAAETTSATAPRSLAVVAAVVLLVAVLPGLLRGLRRRRRLGSDDPDGWWSELRDTVLDTGGPVDPAATPRALAQRWSGRLDEEALGGLVVAVETSRYARPGSDVPDERAGARRLVAQADASVGRWRRLRARLLPVSLLRRR